MSYYKRSPSPFLVPKDDAPPNSTEPKDLKNIVDRDKVCRTFFLNFSYIIILIKDSSNSMSK